MSKKYVIKTKSAEAIDRLIKEGSFEKWEQIPRQGMNKDDIAFIYDINLTAKAKDEKWLPFKCAAELVDVDDATMDLKLLYEINYVKLEFDKDEKTIIADMQQGNGGVYELKDDEIISKLEQQNGDNIVKKVCAELDITQRELAERMDIPESTVARWKSVDLPRLAELYLNALLENIELKSKLETIKKAHEIVSNL